MLLAHRLTIAATALTLLAGLASPARADDAQDEAFYHRASECAAAMQVDQYALVGRARAGDKTVRPALFDITRLGFAYVGEAYLKGLRDPRGGEMLKAASAEQKDWPADRHAAMVKQCRVEAQQIYDASGMWKLLVDNKANKRVDRFMSMPPLPASGASN
ncbi:hypothetical protein [Scleromatobacter humisilvae]|uniref:Secreted protein n=1 Tax=Scleromatobacter humisilvae TaxID=2897159 RepID=A0A9X1YPW8_9BURK|nr:hypothetical protein [Scleromatobacter humisilvae]MCK9688582.1 hypothetical protein [Scleromatobacter humisilvae]